MVRIAPPPAASIRGSTWREAATREYAETSSASQKRSRGVSVKRPSRSRVSAKATEWTKTSSCPPKDYPTSAKNRSRPAEERSPHREDPLEPFVGAHVALGHERAGD